MNALRVRDQVKKADQHYKSGPARPKGIPWPEVEKWIGLKSIIEYLKADAPANSFSPPLTELAFAGPGSAETPPDLAFLYRLKLLPGFYGPFYQYSPGESPRIAGGSFSDVSTDCAACATSRLALFDAGGNRLYPENFLYRHEFYFEINDAAHADVLMGHISGGTAILFRAANWVTGWNKIERVFNSNRVLFSPNPARIPFNHHCKRCRPFWALHKLA